MRKSASMCVCLLSLLTGCAETKTLTVTVYEPVYLPERFLVNCTVPDAPGDLTFRELGALAAKRKAALNACNLQLEAGRAFQAETRQSGQRMPLPTE